MRNGDYGVYHGTVFLMRNHGSVSGSIAWNGTFRCSNDLVRDRYGWNQDRMDFRDFPESQISVCVVYFLSCILDIDHCHAGDLFLFRTKKST